MQFGVNTNHDRVNVMFRSLQGRVLELIDGDRVNVFWRHLLQKCSLELNPHCDFVNLI